MLSMRMKLLPLLLLATPVFGQTNPGFIDNLTLCANYPNPTCQGTIPSNPLSLNQAFMNKQDYIPPGPPKANVVNMLDHGADPTGNTDSCGQGLTAALNILQSRVTGGVLYWPAGIYLCKTQIQWANKPIAILGDGAAVTYLVFDNPATNAAGISISQNTAFPSVVRGMQIQTNVAQPNNSGIKVVYTNTSVAAPTVNIENVVINGGNLDQFYWSNGIWCTGCVYGNINQVFIAGKGEFGSAGITVGANAIAGIFLNGIGLGAGEQGSTDMKITSSVVLFVNAGIYITGNSSGNHIRALTTSYTNYGVYLEDKDTSGDPTAVVGIIGPFISGWDCYTWYACFASKGWTGVQVSGAQLNKVPQSSQNWYGVQLFDGMFGGVANPTSNSLIVNNKITGAGAGGTAIGVQLGPSANGNMIRNNLAGYVNYFADFGAGGTVSNNTFAENQQMVQPGPATFLNGWFLNSPPPAQSLIITRNNAPIATPSDTGIVSLPTGNATPNINGASSDIFAVLNTTPLTITNFVGGYIGQRITLVAGGTGAANVIQGSGPNIFLSGGVNFAMGIGATLTLHQEQSTVKIWREIARTP